MASVHRTRLARQDLKVIGRYIAQESQSTEMALRVLDGIDAKCARYAATPKLGEKRPDLAIDVRQFTVGNYLVIYREIPRGIEVLRVLHGSRDIPMVWRRE
ncbi:MAG: type II toxin-antitoxin system RelE/ParE family toxin [Pirellulales bacterium]